jgi:hypothetical protein
MQTAKRMKYPFVIFLFDANAIVAHRESVFPYRTRLQMEARHARASMHRMISPRNGRSTIPGTRAGSDSQKPRYPWFPLTSRLRRCSVTGNTNLRKGTIAPGLDIRNLQSPIFEFFLVELKNAVF